MCPPFFLPYHERMDIWRGIIGSLGVPWPVSFHQTWMGGRLDTKPLDGLGGIRNPQCSSPRGWLRLGSPCPPWLTVAEGGGVTTCDLDAGANGRNGTMVHARPGEALAGRRKGDAFFDQAYRNQSSSRAH